MKKLLYKWFPKFFTISKTYEFDQIEVLGHPYKLEVINDTSKTFESLGISDKRMNEIVKEVKTKMITMDDKCEILISMEPGFRHINEFYAAVLIMEREIENRRNQQMLLDIMNRNK